MSHNVHIPWNKQCQLWYLCSCNPERSGLWKIYWNFSQVYHLKCTVQGHRARGWGLGPPPVFPTSFPDTRLTFFKACISTPPPPQNKKKKKKIKSPISLPHFRQSNYRMMWCIRVKFTVIIFGVLCKKPPSFFMRQIVLFIGLYCNQDFSWSGAYLYSWEPVILEWKAISSELTSLLGE